MSSVMAVKPKKTLKTQMAVSVALVIARMSQVTLSSVYLQPDLSQFVIIIALCNTCRNL